MTEILNLNTLCRCCHTDGKFKDLSFLCGAEGSMETCTDMLRDIFDIYLFTPPIEASNMICVRCIQKLRNAFLFKKKVLECEKKFQEYCNNELLHHMDIKLEKQEYGDNDKLELDYENNDGDDDKSDLDFESNDYKNELSPINTEYNQESEDECAKLNVTQDLETEDKLTKKSSLKIKREKYTCKICNKKLSTLGNLRSHIQNVHKDADQCKICKIVLRSKKIYERHMSDHTIVCSDPTIPLLKMKEFKCKFCFKTYKTMADLRCHANKHTKRTIYICDYCKREFVYKGMLTRHILSHLGLERKYMCDACGHSFRMSTNLRNHYITVHQKLKLFKCSLCPKEYAAEKNLKVHMRDHTGEKPYECDTCLAKFKSFDLLKSHNHKHENKTNFGGIYVCKTCKKSFDHRGIYTKHLKSHISKYECKLCGEFFTTGYSLKRHMETHETVKRYRCQICEKRFLTRNSLNSHIMRKHKPQPKIKCEVCKKIVLDIKTHMRTHNNRRHKCELCEKSFSEGKFLNRHVKEVHSGIKNKCDICDKEFVLSKSLKRHNLKKHSIDMGNNKTK